MSKIGIVTVRRLNRLWTNGILPIKNSLQSHMDSTSIHVTATEKQSWSGKGEKPTVHTATLTASSWNTSAKTYSLESSYPNSSYDIEIDFNYDSGTTAQYEAYCGAQLGGSASKNVLKAMGEVPTINIPVVVYATAKN